MQRRPSPQAELPPWDIEQQIMQAYYQMANVGRYRPAAPSDGFGNITVPEEELDLTAEARDYARRWWAAEDDCSLEVIACCEYGTRAATIYALEAAQLMCGGPAGNPFARRLLLLALAELDSVVK